MPGIYREIWTDEMQKFVTSAEDDAFLQGLPDYSQYVANVGDESQVIHISVMNVLPDVLTNNTTYPIDVQELDIDDIPITLHKHQTKATPITDDELYAMSPKKMQNVIKRHGQAVAIRKISMAAHALGPAAATANMPILVTTGPDDGTGRKRLIWEDIERLKSDLDALEYQDYGRRLSLSKEHENDLIREDQKFKDQYYNRATGKPYNQLGFDFYSYVQNPYYDPVAKTKLAYGAAPTTHRRATIMFIEDYTAKANGWMKTYPSPAKTDPLHQRNLFNVRHHYIVMPTQERYRAAIVSANAV